MSTKWEDGFELLLNTMGEVAVFVVQEDTHEVLCCNDEAKRQEGNAFCKRLRELWEKQCHQCVTKNIKENKSFTKTIVDDDSKKILRLMVTRIKWGAENIPAFSVVITPVVQGENAAVHLNLLENIDIILSEGYVHSCLVNLTKDEYVNLLPDCDGRNTFLIGKSYEEMLERFYQCVHPLHESEIRCVYSREQLLMDYNEGIQRISHDYLLQNKEGSYRWVRGSVIFPRNSDHCDRMAVMLWKEMQTEKGIAQQLLTEQEALFNSLPGYVLKISVTDDIIFLEASDTFYDFFGVVDKKYQVGDNVFVEDREFVISLIKQKGQKGLPIHFECRVCDKKGNIVWVQCEGRLVDYQKGHPVYLLILLDIHANKLTQMQLLKERERYRLAVVDMAVGIFEYYVRDDYFTYYPSECDKRGAAKKWNYMEKMKQSTMLSKEHKAAFLEILRGKITGAEIEIFVEQNKRYEWFFCQGNPVFEDGTLKKVVGTLRSIDKSKRKQQQEEEKLQREQRQSRMSNQRFLRAVNQLYDLIIEADLISRETYVWKDSDEYGRNLPRDEQLYDFLLNDCFDLVQGEYREEARNTFMPEFLIKEFHKGNSEIVMEMPVGNNKGIYRWHRLQVQLLEESADSLRILIYFKNIHEQKSREAQQQSALKDALKLAEQANAAKGDFLSRMSHDIRTPLNAIMGMASIAHANMDQKETLSDCLEKINSSSKYLLALINDILEMSKIESGKMPFNIKEFDIHDLLQEAVVYGYTQGQLKEQRFSVLLKEGTGGVFEGDPLRLNQILINLLSNAFKYTPPKGEILLSVRGRNLDDNKSLLQIEVQDNGIGIKKSFLERIFLPFEQGEGGLVSGGTGLGLAISQNLAMLMGGHIYVESEEGNGSVFRFELPLKRKPNNSLPKQNKPQEKLEKVETGILAELENSRVLLAEDNEINVEIAKTLLEMYGLVVDVAGDGRECLTLFGQSPENTYLAILMDIQMPVMNGYEASREIRKMEREDAKIIPILAMTANAFPSDIGETMAAGMTEHIPKPIDMSVLLSLLKKYKGEK